MGKGGEGSNFYTAETPKRKISRDELSLHRSPNDAWMTYKGRVYDVTNWNDHPGGSVIFTHAGDDFTDIFSAFHPPSALKELERFYIGELCDISSKSAKPQKQVEFEKSYRELKAKIISLGLFNANYLYYVYKCLSNLLLLAAAFCCVIFSKSFYVHMLGAVFLATFWQQCGWLAHDFLHHQVFKTRFYGDFMGIIVGNLFQGFSVGWWKSKHNTHHAVPNLHESSPDAHDGDPDIDTMPILAWTLRMAETAKDSSVGRFMITWQSVLYFPVLLFARLAWAHQSWVFIFGGVGQWSVKGAKLDQKQLQYPILEKAGLILHYAWLFYLLSFMPILNAAAFFVVSQTLCGLFLALVFGLGHNGMSVYPANLRPDFWTLQVTTTRNVTSNRFVDWFCGGLQYQVDHHLFPMLPRHNLKRVHQMVEQFCKEQGVTYHEAGMLNGTIEVLSHLSKVSVEFISHFPAM